MQLATGASWRQYLELPVEVFAADDGSVSNAPRPPDSGRGGEVDATKLAEVLLRFNAVSAEPSYGRITNLDSFQATHETLAAYLALLPNRVPPDFTPETIPEELPPPPPE